MNGVTLRVSSFRRDVTMLTNKEHKSGKQYVGLYHSADAVHRGKSSVHPGYPQDRDNPHRHWNSIRCWSGNRQIEEHGQISRDWGTKKKNSLRKQEAREENGREINKQGHWQVEEWKYNASIKIAPFLLWPALCCICEVSHIVFIWFSQVASVGSIQRKPVWSVRKLKYLATDYFEKPPFDMR